MPMSVFRSMTRVLCLVILNVTFADLTANGQSAAENLNQKTSLHPHVRSMEIDLSGPFVRLARDRILAFDKNATRISEDDGQSWSDRRLVSSDCTKFAAASPAMIRTKSGILVLDFINTKEMVWKWNDERRDADPGTIRFFIGLHLRFVRELCGSHPDTAACGRSFASTTLRRTQVRMRTEAPRCEPWREFCH